eukprot:TRINITY_DN672_c0_g5_i1.p1 TRINITY_DN672_c0_g5~~TRINITY_DN672_c0_g5_i1.p1  ORF type:complete len:130 (-),score=39.47 TRINITY_DN672_c0_g5_i1:88-477(-)
MYISITSSDTNMDLKYRFSINHHPIVLKVKGNQYSLYNASTEEEIRKVVEEKELGEEKVIPPAKTPGEILEITVKDNLKAFTKLVNVFGLEGLEVGVKFWLSLAILVVPIVLIFAYSCATESKKKTKTS